jgi:carbon storage regulator
MLVLSRHIGQRIKIGEDIFVTVLAVNGKTVRLGIEAPSEIPVLRQELYDCKRHEERTPST